MEIIDMVVVFLMVFLLIMAALCLLGVIIKVIDLCGGPPETDENYLKDWRESLNKACAEIESQYPVGTIIEFMGVEYCVVGYKEPGYGIYCLTSPALKCIYTDGSGNPKAHYFPVEVFCLIEEYVKSRPDNNSSPD